jgi:hypothetical protein
MASSDAPVKNQTGRVAPIQILKNEERKTGISDPNIARKNNWRYCGQRTSSTTK